MVYLIYVTWDNTKGNHAGMKNLCEKLENIYPNKFKAIETFPPKSRFQPSNLKFIGFIYNIIVYKIHKFVNLLHTKRVNQKITSELRLSDGDIVILMEYMFPVINQLGIAKIIRKSHPDIKLYGLAHLVPSAIDSIFNKRSFQKWTSSIDYIVTLGSSLSNYFKTRGVEHGKIITTFHYVDDYYLAKDIPKDGFKVLVQGKVMRDTELLIKIIDKNPNVEFIVCNGLQDLSRPLGNCKNVKLLPFMPESELKNLMGHCPVSLNVMKDTVGSNVITTSIGMGEAMICSDVGSIRDYCDESNCIFCKSEDDFTNALQLLRCNEQILRTMQINSLKKAILFNTETFAQSLLSNFK